MAVLMDNDFYNGSGLKNRMENTVFIVKPEAAPEDNFIGPEFTRYKYHRQDKENTVMCTVCGLKKNFSVEKVYAHPILGVIVCQSCHSFYCTGKFTKDVNGIDEQCRWCGEGGNLLMCDYCTNSFCNYCIKRNFSKAVFEKIRDEPKWKCFVCDRKQLSAMIKECNRVIRKRGETQSKKFEQKGNNSRPSKGVSNNGNMTSSKELDPLASSLVTSNNKICDENDSSFSSMIDGSKKVTPITILREKESFVIQRSTSCVSQKKHGDEKRWQSDPETKQSSTSRIESEKKLGRSHVENNINFANIQEVMNIAKSDSETRKSSSKITKVTEPLSAARRNTPETGMLSKQSATELLEKTENVKNILSTEEQPSTSCVIKPSNSLDKVITKLHGVNVKRNFGRRTGERALFKAAECGVATTVSNEHSLPSLNQNAPVSFGDKERFNYGISEKLKEAEEHLTRYMEIFKEVMSGQCLIEYGGNSENPQSPQYSRFKTTNVLLTKVRRASSKLIRMEHDLRARKSQLGTYREYGDTDFSTSSSEDESELSHMKVHSKRENFSEKHITIADQTPIEYYPEIISIKGNATSEFSSAAGDHIPLSSNDNQITQSVDAVHEGFIDVEPTTNTSMKSDDVKLNMDPKVLIQKLQNEEIVKLMRKDTNDSYADSDSSVGSLDRTSSKNLLHSSSELSESSSHSKDFIPFKTKKKSNAVRKTNNSGTRKTSKVYEDNDSDYEMDDDDDDGEDCTSDSEGFISDDTKFDADDVTGDNEIARDLLLQKMQEQNAETTDSDVDKLINNKISEPVGKKSLASMPGQNQGDSEGTTKRSTNATHPLLKASWRDKLSEAENKDSNNKGSVRIKRKRDNMKRNGEKKRKLSFRRFDSVISDSDLTTDSEIDIPASKRKRGNKSKVLSNGLISDSDDEDLHPIPNFECNTDITKSDETKTIPSDDGNDDSDSDSDHFRSFKKRRRRIVNKTDSDIEKKVKIEPETPKKGGRKNIRKIMDDDEVSQSTQMASVNEMMRRRRVHAEREGEEEKEEIIVIDEDNAERTKEITIGLTLSKSPPVRVHPNIVKNLKPHQIEGVQFLWDNLIEKVAVANSQKGGGCILAHCMGLGKTLQTVAFLHTVITSSDLPKLKSALVLCPLGTVNNWVAEFRKWLRTINNRLNVVNLNSAKGDDERIYKLQFWQREGGVTVMGYGLFRSVLSEAKRITPENNESYKTLLLAPGPDILVCDEGHILKNTASKIAVMVQKITTKRRIILTGTPLQNNMVEYHCMVSIVKPKLLGSLKEFKNRFVNPIENGQHVDSTARDVRIMKRRAHVLHELLSGCVQRKDYSCLTAHLAPKYEYSIKVRLSDLQIRLYEKYMSLKSHSNMGTKNACLFKDFQVLLLLVCHPRCLVMSKERRDLNDNPDNGDDAQSGDEGTSSDDSLIVISDDENETSSSHVPKPTTLEDIHALANWKLRLFIKDKTGKKPETRNRKKLINLASKYLDETFCKTIEFEESLKQKSVSELKSLVKEHGGNAIGCTEKCELVDLVKTLVRKETQAEEEWFEKCMPTQEELYLANEHGSKIVLMLKILEASAKLDDKVVIFSQSLLTLDLIEIVLKAEMKAVARVTKTETEFTKWVKDKDYFRLDGSTPRNLRDKWISQFNDKSKRRCRLFLISTRAGGIGINLIGANRAIVFDSSWNPTHDIQSIFRLYRFGQTKPCYVYRFIAQGTMEERIYERQVVKRSLAYRIVDEQQILRHFNSADIAELYKFNPAPKADKNKVPEGAPPRDPVLAAILMSTDLAVSYHEPDSLLGHQVSEELTEAERKAAWEEYDTENAGASNSPSVPLSVASYLNSLSIVALNSLLKSGEEILRKIQVRISTINDKPFANVMSELQISNRSISTDIASQRATVIKLDRHLALQNFHSLKKSVQSHLDEARKCYEMKVLSFGPNVQSFPPRPATTSSTMRPGTSSSTMRPRAPQPSVFSSRGSSARHRPGFSYNPPPVPYPRMSNSHARGTNPQYRYEYRAPPPQTTRPSSFRFPTAAPRYSGARPGGSDPRYQSRFPRYPFQSQHH